MHSNVARKQSVTFFEAVAAFVFSRSIFLPRSYDAHMFTIDNEDLDFVGRKFKLGKNLCGKGHEYFRKALLGNFAPRSAAVYVENRAHKKGQKIQSFEFISCRRSLVEKKGLEKMIS